MPGRSRRMDTDHNTFQLDTSTIIQNKHEEELSWLDRKWLASYLTPVFAFSELPRPFIIDLLTLVPLFSWKFPFSSQYPEHPHHTGR